MSASPIYKNEVVGSVCLEIRLDVELDLLAGQRSDPVFGVSGVKSWRWGWKDLMSMVAGLRGLRLEV